MKKIGVVVLALAALALLGSPPLFGRLTQSRVEDRVAALAGNPFVNASIVHYDRGWFSSIARIELRPSDAYGANLGAFPADDAPPSLLLRVDLAHGPLAVLDGVHFGAARMVARPDPEAPGHADLLANLGVPYLFEFRGRAGFFGTLDFDADAPPIDVTTTSGSIAFSGAQLEGSARGRAVRYAANVETLALEADVGLRLERFTAAGDNELRGSLPLGRAEIGLERLTVTDVAIGPVLDAANVRMVSDFALDDRGELADGRQTLTLAALDAQPEVELRDLTVDVRYGNVDVAALEAYTEALQRSVAAGVVEPSLVLAEVTPAVERLLRAEPTFAIEPLRFTLNGGSIDARADVRTRPAALPPAGALDLRDPTLWLDVLEAMAEVEIAKELAREIAAEMLGAQIAAANPAVPPDQIRYMAQAQVDLVLITLLGQSMIVDRGATYATELGFGGGTITVNGAVLPLAPTP